MQGRFPTLAKLIRGIGLFGLTLLVQYSILFGISPHMGRVPHKGPPMFFFLFPLLPEV